MLLHLEGYSIILMYWPGHEILLPHSLSVYGLEPPDEMKLNLTILHIHITSDCKASAKWAVHDDPILHALTEMILDGWPEDLKYVPHSLWSYWTHHNVLTVEDRTIPYEEANFIPSLEKEDILHTIHEWDQAIIKYQLQAQNCIYWLGMNVDLPWSIVTCQKS